MNFFVRILFFFSLTIPISSYSFNGTGWEKGVDGHKKVMKSVKGKNKPAIVFFHVDWCGWCKKLKIKYLKSAEMREFLKDIPKVSINPENGKKEKALFEKYGASGYPAFYVYVPDKPKSKQKFSPFVSGKHLSKVEFIALLNKHIKKYSK